MPEILGHSLQNTPLFIVILTIQNHAIKAEDGRFMLK